MSIKKVVLITCVMALAGAALWAFAPSPQRTANKELSIGEKAPMIETRMQDVSGSMVSLKDAAGPNGLIVNFSCNTCPWVARWEDRYNPIAEAAEAQGIGVIAVNSNAAIRDLGESMQDMKDRARKNNYQFPYVLDKNANLARAFGATHTPHIYMFNADMELVYRGAIDDNAAYVDEVETPYLLNAIKQLGAGEPIAEATTKSLGCSIKYPESN